MERTPITAAPASSGRCMRPRLGNVSVNLPAGIRWLKAHTATPYSFSSSEKELVGGCVPPLANDPGRRSKRAARTPKSVSVRLIAAR